jgi:hypothetical protein
MKNTIIIGNNKGHTPFSFSRFKKPYSSSRIEAIHINSIKLKEKTKKEQKNFQIMKIINPVKHSQFAFISSKQFSVYYILYSVNRFEL